MDLSRGFRALKTWFTLRAYGTEQLGGMISQCCALARHLTRRIEAAPELELLAPTEMNIVCFRYRGADPDKLNAEIVADLHEGGRVAPSTTTIDGRLAIRAAIVNHRTRADDLDALVEETIRLGRRKTARLSA
jgi:glutamate/tyrosine decarboxylase-like PLP-dependent enzyme